MKKFFVIYGMPADAIEEMMHNTTPEQRTAGMDAWKEWMTAHKDSFADMGSPIGKNKRVTKDGAIDVKNEVGGYSIILAESHDDAAKMVADCPHFQIPRAYVDVMEMPEMEM